VDRGRWLHYAMLTATAAALGLLLLRAAFSSVPSLAIEFLANRLTYVYVFAVTAAVFLMLGYVLGRQIDELRRLSTTDPLTGLANRRAFQARLHDEWRRAQRYTSPLSLLLIDIDGLKRINDERGHTVGDHVLRTVAHAINTTMRVTDSGSRWGGDEFAIVAPNTVGTAAGRLAQRLLGEVEQRARGREVSVTVSIGVATLAPESNQSATVRWLLNAADEALLRAKSDGRNRVNVA
jgi:two-component system, cell cycle response regulator